MKKLTQKQMEEMWGAGGPYSQVQLTTEERLLDDSVSRVFLLVSVNINPFTFKFVKKHRKKFARNKTIQWILQYCEYLSFDEGYSCYTFSSEYSGKNVMKVAKDALKQTRQAVLLMHAFVINELGLTPSGKEHENVVDMQEYKDKVH